MKALTSYCHGHRRAKGRVRSGVGTWLLALAAFPIYSGSWWGVLPIAPAVLHVYLGYGLQR
jgi:hypothetical protein